MKRKLLALAVAAAMLVSIFAIVGCSVQKEKITIEILTWHGPDSATSYYAGYQEIAQEYMKKNKNIEIKIKHESDGAYGSILETGFAGGTAADIIQMKSSQRLTYSGNLLNLRPYLNEENPYDKRNAKWIGNFVGEEGAFPLEANNTDANANLFIPNDGNPEVYTGSIYIFNVDLIKKAGLDPLNAPKNWIDMFEWLEALNKLEDVSAIAGSSDVGGKVSQIGYQFGEDYANRFFDDQINDPDFAGDLFWDKLYVLTSYEGGEGMPLDSLPYYPAMFKLMKQHISYYQPSWYENSYETELLTFSSGRAAMMVTSFWVYDTLTSSLTEARFPEGFGIFPIPYLGKDTLNYAVSKGWITQAEANAAAPYAVDRYSAGGGAGIHEYGFTVNNAVAGDADKLAAVIDFLRFMSSKEVQDKYVETAKSLSPVKDVKLIDILSNFIVEEPEGGYASRILGYTVVEWGKSGWDVDMIKYLKGEISMGDMVQNVSAPEWAADIPSMDALQEAVDSAEEELSNASEDEKQDKERALRYAQLRLKLYDQYYYNKTGNLIELR